MKYSVDEIMEYVREEDVKFIRLAFVDVFGRQKNISVMPHELERVFDAGAAIDASAIAGFGGEVHSDLFLRPDPSTITVLPWRPEHGRVVRMFCEVTRPDGSVFEADTRALLKQAVERAERQNIHFFFGSELEFYLFRTDEFGASTRVPYDRAGYMDIAPDDKGENVRREICLTLEQMGIRPESSHHEEGPGQNEIDFRFSDPLSAADNSFTFCTAVRTIAARNGLYADFSPKPLEGHPGNGFHVNFSAAPTGKGDLLPYLVGGILGRIREMTAFFNPCDASYARLGSDKAPAYVSWSRENRSQLIRIPAAVGEYRRMELRSPDPSANPYLVFSLMIDAALEGIAMKKLPGDPADFNFYTAPQDVRDRFERLPASLEEARALAGQSAFIREHLPACIVRAYCGV